jgi:hypothetical protein
MIGIQGSLPRRPPFLSLNNVKNKYRESQDRTIISRRPIGVVGEEERKELNEGVLKEEDAFFYQKSEEEGGRR